MRLCSHTVRRGLKRQIWRLYHHRVTLNRNVHQIVFADPGSPTPSDYIDEAMRSVRKAFPRCHYTVWSLNDAVAFIAEHFPPDVLRAFHCLRPYAYKADLFKYCVLHVIGGWYVDAGIRMLKSPLSASFAHVPTPPEFVLFSSRGGWSAPWDCSLALLYAEPGHPVFTTAIAEVVANCRERRYGTNPICPTMTPFGRALAIHDVRENIKLGYMVDVKGSSFGRAYELQPFGLVATKKPNARGGDVASVGLAGSNNYAEMWKQREVFGTW